MKKITLYIGLNDKDTKTQIVKTTYAQKDVINILTSHGIVGMTMQYATGLWVYEDRTIASETTLHIELMGVELPPVMAAIEDIKVKLNQESIGLTVEDINVQFV